MFKIFDYLYFDIFSKFEFRASDFRRLISQSERIDGHKLVSAYCFK